MSLEERLKRASPQQRAEALFEIESSAFTKAEDLGEKPAVIPFKKYLSTLLDYSAYYALHPEWHGRNSHALRSESSFNRFRVALYKKVASARTTPEMKKKFLDDLFDRRGGKWKGLRSIDDCKRFIEQYPASKTYASPDADKLRTRMSEMVREKLIEESQLNNFIRETYGTLARPTKVRYETYKARVDAHPEWRTMTRKQLQSVPRAWSTYTHMLAWLRDNVRSAKKRKEMRIAVFGPLNTHPSKYPTSLEGWKTFIPEHPYITSSFEDLNKDKDARLIYDEFTRWLQDNFDDKQRRSRERNALYPFAKVFK